MKKRYIYSALLSGVLFAIIYLIVDINIFISLLLTVIAYLGGIFFFKEKDVRTYEPNTIMHYCYLISKIANYKNYIDDKKIQDDITDITENAERIIVMLQQKTNKVTQVYDGFDYFLPLTIKVIEQYFTLTKRKNLTDEEKKFMNGINEFLDNIEVEMKKMLDNMNYTKMLDINSSIEVFQNGNKIVKSKLLESESSENA